MMCSFTTAGSEKFKLCLKAVGMNPGWGHFRYATYITYIKIKLS